MSNGLIDKGKLETSKDETIVHAAVPHLPSPIQYGSHMPSLDAIRGIAILLVMLHHFNVYDGSKDAGLLGNMLFKISRLGGSGVDLFFILSGFLITGILVDTKSDRHFFRNFYIRRTLRIFPLYYGVLVLYFIVLPLFNVVIYPTVVRYQAWLWLYGTNIFQSWNESYLFLGFDHFWSLAVEEHFYLVWPFVIYFCSRKAAIWVCLSCIIIALFSRIALMMSGDHAISVYALTLCRIDSLATGGLIALALRSSSDCSRLKPIAKIALLASGVFLFCLYIYKIDLPKMDSIVLIFRFTLSSLFFGAFLFFAVISDSIPKQKRIYGIGFLIFFGKYSYGLYVFHYLLIPVFNRIFPADRLALCLHSVFLGQLAYSILAITISLCVAMLSWHLYEKHFLKLKDVFAPKITCRT